MQCLWRSNLGTGPSEISNPVRADVTSRRSASRMVLPVERAHARELRSAAEEWDLVKLSGDRLNLPGKRANLQRSTQKFSRKLRAQSFRKQMQPPSRSELLLVALALCCIRRHSPNFWCRDDESPWIHRH